MAKASAALVTGTRPAKGGRSSVEIKGGAPETSRAPINAMKPDWAKSGSARKLHL